MIFAIGKVGDTGAHTPRHGRDNLLARLGGNRSGPALDDIQAAAYAQEIGRDLGHVIATAFARHADVEENNI